MDTKRFLKALGPGILFASTCIGVSHLVQSTRAGAVYGFGFLGAIILANLFKYPFFEFASRYTGATGHCIIDGYQKRGKWVLVSYLLITVPSMFTVTAAVTYVTAGLLSNLLGLEMGTNMAAAVILLICIVILAVGRYKLLDNLLKLVGIVLLVSTVVAFFSVLMNGRATPVAGFVSKETMSVEGLIFVIALMGWMPTAVDISTWTSLWAEAKIKASGHRPTLKESLLDFNLGYWLSAGLAICFLTLGAYVIYGTGTELSNNSSTFAGQLISMFTSAIGQWSYVIIAIAAFSTMFSTTITVIDGYSRAIRRTTFLLFPMNRKSETRKSYVIWALVVCSGGFLVVSQFLNSLKQLVDLATIVSFVIAPLAAYLNYKVIYSSEISDENKPPLWMKWLAVAGLVFLGVFTIIYFVLKVNPDLIANIL